MASVNNTNNKPKRCYHCGFENTECKLKYFNNKKLDQPRFKCSKCTKLFTLEFHGRPQGKTYRKKRGEDPEELRHLYRQCPHCLVPYLAQFKYYNNGSNLQPRFKCMRCETSFQMRLVIEGEDRYLVHSSSSSQNSRRGCRSKAAKPCPLAPVLLHANNIHSPPPSDASEDLLHGFLVTPSSPSMLVYPKMDFASTSSSEDHHDFATFLDTAIEEDGPAQKEANGLMAFDCDSATYSDLETAMDDGPVPEADDGRLLASIFAKCVRQTMLKDDGPTLDAKVGVSQVEVDMGQASMVVDDGDTGIDVNAEYNKIWNEHLEPSLHAAYVDTQLPCVAEGPVSPNSGWECKYPIAPESQFSCQQALDESNNDGDWDGILDMNNIHFV